MTKSELLNKLFQDYNLVFDPNDPNSKDNDVFVHKHYKIITRTGIQKIEKAAGIKCNVSIANSGSDFCNVIVHGKTGDGVEYTTLASANANNTQNTYYCEMAEKRGRSRVILTLAGLYEQGVFGEDEADDFDQSNNTKTAQYKGR
jgi:hypothetical protein